MLKRIIRVFTFLKGLLLFAFVAAAQSAMAQSVVHTNQLPTGPINDVNTFSGDGDGYNIIPFKDRFYFLGHHGSPAAQGMGCIERQVGSGACANFGTPSSQPGLFIRAIPDGDLNPVGSIPTQLSTSTASANEEYAIVDDRYLFHPVTRTTYNSFYTGKKNLDWGMGCFDLQTHTECGYTAVSTNPDNVSLRVAVEGPFRVGNKLYLLDLEMKLYCFDLAISSPALSQCSTPVLDLYSDSNFLLPKFTRASGDRSGYIGGEVVDDKLYLTVIVDTVSTLRDFPVGSTVADSNKIAVCIDTAGSGMTRCAGWPNAGVFSGRERSDNYSNFLSYDTSANPTMICNGNSVDISCLSLADGSDMTASAPPIYGTTASGSRGFGLGGEIYTGTRTYFPIWAGARRFCFDWTTQSECAGFSQPLSSNPEEYAYSLDEQGCAWSFGHRNMLSSFDPETGAEPCSNLTYRDKVEQTCTIDAWQSLDISTIDNTLFQSAELRVKKSDGTWFDTPLNSSSYSVDLTAADYAGLSDVEYEVNLTAANGVNNITTAPLIEVSATKDSCVDLDKATPTNADEDGSGTVTFGDTLTYTLTATNNGDETQTNMVVSDPLITNSSITCPSVPAGQSCTLTGTYVVDGSDVQYSWLTNTGSVVMDLYPDPITDTVQTPVDCPNYDTGLKTTMTCDQRYIRLTKTVVNASGVALPPMTYPVRAMCDGGVTRDVDLTTDNPIYMGYFFLGTICTLNEPQPDNSVLPPNCEWDAPVYLPSSTVNLSGTDSRVKDVEIVNTVTCGPTNISGGGLPNPVIGSAVNFTWATGVSIPASAAFLTEGGLNAGLGATAEDVDFAEAFDAGLLIGGGIKYNLGKDHALTANLAFAQNGGNAITAGFINGEPLRGKLSDMERVDVELGYRRYVSSPSAARGMRPYIEGRLGGSLNNAVKLEEARLGSDIFNGGTVPLYESGMALTAAGLIGAELPVSDKIIMGVETGLRFHTAPKSDNRYFTPGTPLGGINNASSRVSVPFSVKAEMKF